MIMAIAGAAFLTQVQGVVSDQSGSIIHAYWVPGIAFLVVAWYSAVVAKKHETVSIA
jgi:MFS transporter, FHS family, L-fucose permease